MISGETTREVAAKLGTTANGLTHARIKGTLRARYITPVMGRGKLQPLLAADRLLNPCKRDWALAEPWWGWTAQWLLDRLPDETVWTLRRVPRFGTHVARGRYDEHRHPEVDGVGPPRKSVRLPAPPKEDLAAWAKWSRSGHYLGDEPSNWRKRPDDLGERPAVWRVKKKRKPAKYVSVAAGSLHFDGFDWICPICERRCKMLYLPLRPVNVLEKVQPRIAQCVDVIRKHKGFACKKCHRVEAITGTLWAQWNKLIAHLTAGLLYGHEVKRPAWFAVNDRKTKYAPRPNAKPSQRRIQITELRARGKKAKEIAKELGLSINTVRWYLVAIYKRHDVHSRKELAHKMGRTLQPRAELKRDIASNNVRAPAVVK